MNVRHHMSVLLSFSVKNIFCKKMDLRLFYFRVTICDTKRISKISSNMQISSDTVVARIVIEPRLL